MCHFPPGTSKWNKIEHRLFCHITRTWAARPLMTREDAVAGIAATVTAQGLKCTAVLDDRDYPAGVKVSGERMTLPGGPRPGPGRVPRRVELHRPARPPPGPAGAGPAPGPDLQGLAALAGVADLPALLAAVAVPFAAAREQRLHLDRGRPRRKASGGGPRALPYEAIVTAAACRLRLRMPWRLLGEFLGVDGTTVTLAANRAIPLLQAHGIAPAGHRPRITTLDELRAHAESAGITIDIGTTLQAAANHAKRSQPRSTTRPN